MQTLLDMALLMLDKHSRCIANVTAHPSCCRPPPPPPGPAPHSQYLQKCWMQHALHKQVHNDASKASRQHCSVRQCVAFVQLDMACSQQLLLPKAILLMHTRRVV